MIDKFTTHGRGKQVASNGLVGQQGKACFHVIGELIEAKVKSILGIWITVTERLPYTRAVARYLPYRPGRLAWGQLQSVWRLQIVPYPVPGRARVCVWLYCLIPLIRPCDLLRWFGLDKLGLQVMQLLSPTLENECICPVFVLCFHSIHRRRR